MPDERHPEPWTVWTQWLAQRGLGLVPIAEPKSFNWPGPWLAVLNAPDEGDDVGAVAFGSPPGIAWKPLDGPETFDAVQAGYVIAPADVALWSPSSVAAPRRAGRVEAIVIAPEAEAPDASESTARSREPIADSRVTDTSKSAARSPTSKAAGTTSHSSKPRCSTASSSRRAGSRPKRPAETSLTRGIDLNALVGKPFTIGDVQCLGQRLCEPCAHLERLTAKAGKPGTLRALIHKGGLRADVLNDGEIRVGDDITAR